MLFFLACFVLLFLFIVEHSGTRSSEEVGRHSSHSFLTATPRPRIRNNPNVFGKFVIFLSFAGRDEGRRRRWDRKAAERGKVEGVVEGKKLENNTSSSETTNRSISRRFAFVRLLNERLKMAEGAFFGCFTRPADCFSDGILKPTPLRNDGRRKSEAIYPNSDHISTQYEKKTGEERRGEEIQ